VTCVLLCNVVAIFRYDYVTRGFPVGFVAPPAFEGGRKMHFLYNHVRIVLKYHEDYEAFKGARIVGFQVRSCSSSRFSL